MKEYIPTEHEEQVALFDWAFRLGLDMFAIPNGGDRHPAVAKKLKLEGVKPGVPDVFLAEPKGIYHGLFIEMKRKKGGHVSEDQKRWIEILRNKKYKVIICKGFEQAKEVINEYLIFGEVSNATRTFHFES